ncbi:hypothetical protein HYDPIDRAFT_34551 [Hydnomerulius pinastri MD-312]|uniref:Unplaced genomic scaffold scaffold_171, whole genome shotgun sequence n=1 Tax=Hydnomerulius pinastri MD-312 TaxID=994086 RepID=A0A0C9UYD3_9AGAM|nr:hypothetical protein HYDPIDRAFT_34551 [Hydnomerulius pinastri MD-312]
MLPELPLPVTVSPQDPKGQLDPSNGCPHSELPTSISPPPHVDAVPDSDLRRMLKTPANSFGLFRVYDQGSLPSHGPRITSKAAQPRRQSENSTSTDLESSFFPYPNENSFRLGDWYWNQGTQLSQQNFQKLLELIGSAEFRAEDVQNTNWTTINCQLGNLDPAETPLATATPSATTDIEEWLDADSGWIRSTVTVSVLFHHHCLHPGPKDYPVNDFYHRSLTSIIRKTLLDPTHHQHFHYEPYELCWQPPHKAQDLRIHGELFTSNTFLDAHRNATLLTTFSDAKLWPLYMFLGNEPKDKQGQPTAYLCTHVAYFQSLPDSFKDCVLENTGSKLLGDAFFTHCHRELFHAQRRVLLDDDFIEAYTHGLVLSGYDGVKHHLYPRIFTYSADYPEKVLIASMRNLGVCPCPRCLIPKDHVPNIGSERDMLQRQILARSDTEEKRRKVAAARRLIYENQYVVDTPQVEELLKDESLVPTVAGASRL